MSDGQSDGQTATLSDTLREEIPLDLAIRAHQGTSHSPERRGHETRAGYAATLLADYARLSQLAIQHETYALLEAEFDRYCSGYRARFLRYLEARARCVSTLVTGPANFPTARAAKRSGAADKASAELAEYRERALRAAALALAPTLAPIASGAEDAVERIRAKLAERERFRTFAKDLNATIRKHRAHGREWLTSNVQACLVRHGQATAADIRAKAEGYLKPDALGRVGVPDYAITNLGAEIRRLRARLGAVSAAKATPATEDFYAATGIVVNDLPASNRVRISFPDKPSEETRSALKAHGFRWVPTAKAWQAFRNPSAIEYAKKVAGGTRSN